MNSKERILAALRREPVDYVPCCVAFNPLTPPQRRDHTWNFPWAEDAPAETKLAFQVEELGLDQVVGTGAELCRPADGVESRVCVEGDALHKVWTTPAGELHACVRLTDGWPHGHDIPFFSDFNIGHFVEPWIRDEADLERLKHVLRPCDTASVLEELRTGFARAKALADRWGLAVIAHVGKGLTGAMPLFGAEGLCMATLQQPELVDAWMQYEHGINLRTIEVLGELGVDIVRRNGFYETADFYGPQMLARFVGPRVSREAEAARACGMVTSYTVHTGLMPILDYLAGLSVDSLFGVDVAL